MNKMIIAFFVVLFTGCGIIRHNAGTFEHIVVRKPNIKNPSFSVHVEGAYQDQNVWLKEEIENALLFQKVSVFNFKNVKTLVSQTKGEGKAFTQNRAGDSLSNGNINITSTTEFQSNVKTDLLFLANYDYLKFSIILMDTQEIIAKGTFTAYYSDDIKKNVQIILQEMGIIP